MLNSLLHIGIGIGCLMIALLAFKPRRNPADPYLMGWIGVFIGQMLFYELTIYQQGLSGSLAILGFSLMLLNMPLLYGYIRSMVGKPLSWKEALLHGLPFLLFCAIFLYTTWLRGIAVEGKNGYLLLKGNVPHWLTLYGFPSAILGAGYAMANLRLLMWHQRRLPQIFSNEDRNTLRWIQYLIWGYVFFTGVVTLLVFSATHFGWLDINIVFSLVGAAIGLMVSFSGFWGLRQTDIFANILPFELPNAPAKEPQYTKSGLKEEKAQTYAAQLRHFMESEQPYLNENLTLPLLAESLSLSPTHLSQVINQQFDQNFFDFVNGYRVREAQRRMLDPEFEHLSLLGIGLDCGFSSKSSFNRAFKKFSDQTPSQFRKNSSPQ